MGKSSDTLRKAKGAEKVSSFKRALTLENIYDMAITNITPATAINAFSVPSKKHASKHLEVLKSLYEVSSTLSEHQYGHFDTLITESMADESLWEQLQTRNKPLTRAIKKKIGKLSKISGTE